jgi:hypothetical protein
VILRSPKDIAIPVCTEYVYAPLHEDNPSLASQAIGNWSDRITCESTPDSEGRTHLLLLPYSSIPGYILSHWSELSSFMSSLISQQESLLEDFSMVVTYKEQKTAHRSDIAYKETPVSMM